MSVTRDMTTSECSAAAASRRGAPRRDRGFSQRWRRGAAVGVTISASSTPAAAMPYFLFDQLAEPPPCEVSRRGADGWCPSALD